MSDGPAPDNADDLFDDNVPWADASIRRDYEAALGGFILAFNQLDNLLGKVLRTVLTRLGRVDLISDCVDNAGFGARIATLDVLKQSKEGATISAIPIDQLRSVANERNKLAHSHFEQNPFSGEYWLVGKKDRPGPYYSAEGIGQASECVGKVWTALRHAEAYYHFADVPIIPPPDESVSTPTE